jgi:hypothetical protein
MAYGTVWAKSASLTFKAFQNGRPTLHFRKPTRSPTSSSTACASLRGALSVATMRGRSSRCWSLAMRLPCTPLYWPTTSAHLAATVSSHVLPIPLDHPSAQSLTALRSRSITLEPHCAPPNCDFHFSTCESSILPKRTSGTWKECPGFRACRSAAGGRSGWSDRSHLRLQ